MSLDPALHHPARIAIASRLMLVEHMRFTALRDATGLTSGNLASHLAALEKAGYVTQRDAIIRLRPGKLVAMTPTGREAFRAYVSALEALVAELNRSLRA
jgi:DNA-binding MarR family transcriptional regulator